MKKTLEQAALLAVLLVLAGCAGNEPAEPKWVKQNNRAIEGHNTSFKVEYYILLLYQ